MVVIPTINFQPSHIIDQVLADPSFAKPGPVFPDAANLKTVLKRFAAMHRISEEVCIERIEKATSGLMALFKEFRLQYHFPMIKGFMTSSCCGTVKDDVLSQIKQGRIK
jgi:hypothetical protein